MTKLIRIFLPLLVSLFGITSHAREACYDLFLKKVLQAKATKQWLLWENTYNVEQFRRHQVEYNLDTAIVPKAELVSETTENYSIKEKKFVEDVMRLFKTSSGEVVWPFHPMNENQEIDFFSLNRSPKKIKAYATASRSMVIQTAKHLFSIKMPTNKVFENQKVNSKEPDKTRVSEDIISAHLRKKLIDKKDQLLGVDPDIILLTDYVSFKNPKTGNGILIRDLTKLNDGFYYLPVMSVPYAGIKIARMHNSNVHDFWGKYLAKSVGRAKAKLLLRYGIQLTHPHGQNILLQLDADYLPTGRVAFRDIGDSYLANKKLARALHIESETQNDKANDIKTDDIKFSSDYTFKRFDAPEAPRDFSDQGTLKDWNRIHNESFLEEVFRFTGQSAKEFEALKNYRPSKGNERYHTYESDILKQSYFLQMYLLDNNNVLKALAKIHSKTE